MANNMLGSELNIDGLLEFADKAQKAMDNVANSSEGAGKKIADVFKSISTQGIDNTLQKLYDLKATYESISNVQVKDAGLKEIATNAKTALDEVNKLIEGLSKAYGAKAPTSTTAQQKAEADDVSRINELYRQRIALVKEFYGYVNTASKRELTAGESSAMGKVRGKDDYIANEIEKYKQRQDLSDKAIAAIIENERKLTVVLEQEGLKQKEIEAKFQAEVTKAVEAEIEKEKQSRLKALSDQIKAEQEYAERVKKIKEARATAQQKKNQAYNTTAKGALEFSNNATSINCQQKAIEYLTQARAKLNLQTKEGQKQAQILSDRIRQHTDNINRAKQSTDEYQKSMRKLAQQRLDKYITSSPERAIANSQNAKSINDQIRAIQLLKQTRDNLNRGSFSSEEAYRKKVAELTAEINRQQTEVDKLRGKQEGLGKSHRSLMNTTDQLQRKLALLFSVSAIQGYVNKLISVRGEFELQAKSLEVLLQNKDEANKLWNQTVQLAVKSPFTVKELVTYTKQLAAYRIESDKLYETNKMLADVSAGLGVDMQRLILAYGQVKAANFLRGTELRQFSEAGVNMLDELAKRFTTLEGRAVSVGDVFERISKRMVSFADVEAVFKTITSEGGVFYQMQEKQAETLRGMVSNLKDQIDLMLNSIGKSQEGTLKGMISIIRDLISNWRIFATVLKQVATTMAIISIAKFASGWALVAKEGAAAAMAMNGMAGAGARLNVALKAIGGTIKAHPILFLVGVLASAGFALWDYIDAVNEANEVYDENSRLLVQQKNKLEDIQSSIERNNAVLKESKKDTDDYNEALKSNNALYETLKTQYPEVYKGITQQKNGVIELNNAIEQQNKLLQMQILLQQQAKGGFWQDDLTTNVNDAVAALTTYRAKMSQIAVAAEGAQVKVANMLQSGKITDAEAKALNEYLKALAKAKNIQEIQKLRGRWAVGSDAFKLLRAEINAVGSSFNKYNVALNDLSANLENQKDAWSAAINELLLDPEKGEDAAREYIKKQLEQFQIYDTELKKWAFETVVKMVNVKLTWDDGNSNTSETPKLEGWRKQLNDAINDLNKSIGGMAIPISIQEIATTDKEVLLKKVEDLANDALTTANKTIKGFAAPGQVVYSAEDKKTAEAEKKAYEEFLKKIGYAKDKDTSGGIISEQVKLIRDAQKAYQDLNKDFNKGEAKTKVIDSYADAFKEIGLNIKDIDFTNVDGVVTALKSLRDSGNLTAKQMALVKKAIAEVNLEKERPEVQAQTKALFKSIEKMFDQYDLSLELDKLNIPPDLAKQLFNIDTLSLDELKEKVTDAFMGVEFYSERIKDAGKLMKDTFNGNVDLLNRKLIPAQELANKGWKDVGEGIATVFSSSHSVTDANGKNVDILVTPILPDGTVMSEKELDDYISNNIEGAKDILKADKKGIIIHAGVDLDDGLGEYLHSLQEVFYASDMLSEDQKKKYEEFLKKISEMEDKEQIERLKTYSKYLVKGMNERVKIKSEELRQIAEVEKEPAYTQEQKKTIKTAIQKETQKKLDKQAWKEFTGSDYYIEIFADLDKISTSVIKSMLARLKSLKDSLKNLDATEMKQLVEAMEKMDKELQSREGHSFKDIASGFKEYFQYLKKSKQYKGSQNKIQDLEISKSSQTNDVALAKQEYETAVDTYGVNSDQAMAAHEIYLEKKRTLDATLDQLVAEGEISAELAEQIKEGPTTKLTLEQRLQKNAQDLNEGYQAFEGMMQSIQSVTGSFGEDTNDFIENVGKVVGGIATVENGLSQVLDGKYITGTFNMVSGVFQSIGGFLGFGNKDKKKERQIQREIELVEKLEKAYEKLEKAIDEAYELDTLNRSYKNANDNIQQQINAYNNMIAQEQSKKDSDQSRIDEWNARITELREQQEQLLKDQVESLGGSYDIRSITREFVDAWLEAFKETGDGLEGLKDNFKEFFQNILLEQAVMAGAGTLMEPLLNEINSALEDNFKIDTGELAKIREISETTMEQVNEYLLTLFGEGGILNDFITESGDRLSGLQKGIQGITEAQADILTAYLNSLRFYVADSNAKLTQLVDMQTNDSIPNPLLAELKAQNELVRGISTLLNSLTAPHPTQAGRGLKVII